MAQEVPAVFFLEAGFIAIMLFGRQRVGSRAARSCSQIFMFVGAVALIPLILVYTGYACWVFRGKLDPGVGYH